MESHIHLLTLPPPPLAHLLPDAFAEQWPAEPGLGHRLSELVTPIGVDSMADARSTLDVEVVDGSAILVCPGRNCPIPRLDLLQPMVGRTAPHLLALLDAKVVETNASPDERGAAVKAALQLRPENGPASD